MESPLPVYLDRHEVPGVTAEDVAAYHLKDLELQERFDVKYLTYWYDDQAGVTFCLVRGPDMETVETVHRESHGLVPSRIIEVDMDAVGQFLGRVYERPAGEPYVDIAFRTILFTDMVGSTNLTQRLGDAVAMEVLRTHDRIVRDSVEVHGGRVVKHTGDGVMACFSSVAHAIESAIAIARRLNEHNLDAEHAIAVRVGLSAGEPVTENDDLFGAAVQQAARICNQADPESILVSGVVRDLALGKGFRFQDRGEVTLKGFEEPTRLYEVRWTP